MPTDDWVAIHCDATSYDPATAKPLVFSALRIRGNRILTGSGLILEPHDIAKPEAGQRLRRTIGGRRLVGYFVDFSVAMAERLIGQPLPNERVEVSSLYYDRKIKTQSKSAVDLRLETMIQDLDLPVSADGARGKALAAALAWARLTER